MRTLFLFLLISNFVQAQAVSKKNALQAKRYTSNAINLFNEGQSVNAYMMLSQAYALDSTNLQTIYWLATSEFDLRAYPDAQTHIQKVLKLAGAKATLEYLTLAIQCNMALNFHQEALLQLAEAKKLLNNEKDYKTLGLATFQQQCEFAIAAFKGGEVQNQRTLLGNNLNTKYDEYGPIFHPTNGHLYFTSRNPDTKGANLNPDDQRYFEDIYEATPDPETKGAWVKLFDNYELINTQGFDALSYISKNGLYGLGTVNTTASLEQNTESSDIFELTTEKAGTWDDKQIIRSIPGLNLSYFEGSPTLTDTLWTDGDNFTIELYFVSDRLAEKYATEIFTLKNTNGIWQETATPLAQGINTEGRETTPFVSPDGQWLVFASDTHPGMGGYDLFYCHLEDDKWSAPQNLGAQINTSLDDTHLQIDWKNNKIVWASVSELEGVYSYNLFEAPIQTLPPLFFVPKPE
ncbi:MAG: hypothetical protein RL078_1169 [Bacteroidota bacterium]